MNRTEVAFASIISGYGLLGAAMCYHSWMLSLASATAFGVGIYCARRTED